MLIPQTLRTRAELAAVSRGVQLYFDYRTHVLL